MAKSKQKSVFDVECPKCKVVIGYATSNKQASKILTAHMKEPSMNVFHV